MLQVQEAETEVTYERSSFFYRAFGRRVNDKNFFQCLPCFLFEMGSWTSLPTKTGAGAREAEFQKRPGKYTASTVLGTILLRSIAVHRCKTGRMHARRKESETDSAYPNHVSVDLEQRVCRNYRLSSFLGLQQIKGYVAWVCGNFLGKNACSEEELLPQWGSLAFFNPSARRPDSIP